MRIIISIVIVWHFTAIFLAALSIGTTSPLVIRVAQGSYMQYYLDLLFLNQGHSFFAPDVGPGNIVRYELFDERGSRIDRGEGQLPDRKEHWPRLRYHRHFMLADQASLDARNDEESNYWQRKYLEMYARHLLRTNENAYSARVTRIMHWPLPRDEAEKGTKFTDPRSYEKVLEVTQRRTDLEPPPAPTNQSQTLQGSPWQSTNRVNAAGRWSPGGVR